MNPELYHDRARRLLVYRTEKADFLLAHLPDAKRVNGSCIALPASLRNVQLMRLLDHPVPGIMEASGYDWPIERGRKPLAHQKLMAEFMVSHPRSFNLSDMGTMKTLATLWAADFIMQQYPQGECRAVIVAPLSILQRVWGDAIFANFLGRRTFQIIHGDGRKRQESFGLPADFYIINFDGLGVGATTRKRFELSGLSKDIYERDDIKLGIIDEASAYRDARTKRHRIARLLLGKRDYLWQLTGTPTSNGPTDAFGLAKLCNNARGESFSSFHNRTMMRVSQFKFIPRAGAYEEARKLLTPAIRFDLKDVWDGPEMTTQQREVALTQEQLKAMKQLKRDLQITLHSGQPITAVNEGAARQKFIQISLGAVYDEGHRAHGIDASPRLNELKTLIEQAPGKILCFVPLTSVVNMLYRELKGSVSCEVVNGETTTRERERIFSAFQSDEPDNARMLIADPGTMAHGLDLWKAQTVIWYGPTDRTELYLQANRRAYRPGQKYPVTVVQIVSNKLEREVYRRLESNESLQGVLLQMVREGKI
jgi:SNF2 family DNA or RNA helicase